jgi:hypothetical protein
VKAASFCKQITSSGVEWSGVQVRAGPHTLVVQASQVQEGRKQDVRCKEELRRFNDKKVLAAAAAPGREWGSQARARARARTRAWVWVEVEAEVWMMDYGQGSKSTDVHGKLLCRIELHSPDIEGTCSTSRDGNLRAHQLHATWRYPAATLHRA